MVGWSAVLDAWLLPLHRKELLLLVVLVLEVDQWYPWAALELVVLEVEEEPSESGRSLALCSPTSSQLGPNWAFLVLDCTLQVGRGTVGGCQCAMCMCGEHAVRNVSPGVYKSIPGGSSCRSGGSTLSCSSCPHWG